MISTNSVQFIQFYLTVYTHTPHVCVSAWCDLSWYMVVWFIQNAPRRQQFHAAPAMSKPNSAVSTPLGWMFKTRYKKLVTHIESHASAVSLLQSGEKRCIKAINNNNNNSNRIHAPWESSEPNVLRDLYLFSCYGDFRLIQQQLGFLHPVSQNIRVMAHSHKFASYSYEQYFASYSDEQYFASYFDEQQFTSCFDEKILQVILLVSFRLVSKLF